MTPPQNSFAYLNWNAASANLLGIFQVAHCGTDFKSTEVWIHSTNFTVPTRKTFPLQETLFQQQFYFCFLSTGENPICGLLLKLKNDAIYRDLNSHLLLHAPVL